MIRTLPLTALSSLIRKNRQPWYIKVNWILIRKMDKINNSNAVKAEKLANVGRIVHHLCEYLNFI